MSWIESEYVCLFLGEALLLTRGRCPVSIACKFQCSSVTHSAVVVVNEWPMSWIESEYVCLFLGEALLLTRGRCPGSIACKFLCSTVTPSELGARLLTRGRWPVLIASEFLSFSVKNSGVLVVNERSMAGINSL
jgi:hypothetical protein